MRCDIPDDAPIFRVRESGVFGRAGALVEGALDVQDGGGCIRVYLVTGPMCCTFPGEIEPVTPGAEALASLVATMRAGHPCSGIPLIVDAEKKDAA